MRHKIVVVILLGCGAAFAIGNAGGAQSAQAAKPTDACEKCHGQNGASAKPEIPIIGGLSAAYIKSCLESFQKKERECSVSGAPSDDMCGAAKNLTKAEIAEAAKSFSGKRFVRADQRFDAALAKKGQEIHGLHCEQCHSGGGSAAGDDIGILAGQWMAYLDSQFKAFASGKRPVPDLMAPMLKKVDAAGIEALVNYYGSFR